jgi:hypothetical protein
MGENLDFPLNSKNNCGMEVRYVLHDVSINGFMVVKMFGTSFHFLIIFPSFLTIKYGILPMVPFS